MRPALSKLLELFFGIAAAAAGVALFGTLARAQAPDPKQGSDEAEEEPSAPAPASDPTERAASVDVASYSLEARLDDAAKTITGKGTLTWTNASAQPTRELYFHLYLNAFKNDRTLFLRSPFGAGRSGEHASEWGYIDVQRMTVRELGGVEIWSEAEKHSPGDADDQTDIRVPLPSDIQGGQTVHIDFSWTLKLPRIVERTGYMGDFFLVGQWYPKIARREANGTWAHFAFHPQAEFYADFGHYAVTLDVPERMVVGSTGVVTERHSSGGRQVLSIQADRVHDFAWTAWERFETREETIDGTKVVVLSPPGHEATARATFELVRFALPHFNVLYGKYPHPILTIVHPPSDADNAGGMEYPTLITTGGSWFFPLLGIRSVEAVTVHELGHQWFQGTIATNEPAWPFLDEGVNSYAESEALGVAYGDGSLFDGLGLSLSEVAAQRAFAASVGHDDAVAQPAAGFSSFFSLGGLVYSRTATILTTFANVYGKDRVQRALGNYAKEFQFRHPGPKEFLDAMERELGAAAASALRTALFDKGWIDYLVETVDCVHADPPAGVFDRSAGRETVKRDSAAETWTCRALCRRHGTLELPVEIELVFDDGHRERRRWDGHGTNVSITSTGPKRVTAAVIDPDLRVVLDENLGNNAAHSRGRPGVTGFRIAERLTYFAELALLGMGP